MVALNRQAWRIIKLEKAYKTGLYRAFAESIDERV